MARFGTDGSWLRRNETNIRQKACLIPSFDVLAVIGKDGRYKAIVYNFACHAANTRESVISADYPGDVQQHVQKHLAYEVPTLFLTGACGDVNPVASEKREHFGEKLGGEIVRCLGKLEPIATPSLSIESREMQMPGREHPEFNEADVARKWPGQLEHYKTAFNDMKKREKPSYQCFFTGIRIGDDFAIVTNPDELFCEIGLSIKKQSPFKHTMVAEQTNGVLTAMYPRSRRLKAAAMKPGSANIPISPRAPPRSLRRNRFPS